MIQPLLLPIPRDLQVLNEGAYTLTSADRIQIPAHNYLFTAKWLQSALEEIGIHTQIVAGNVLSSGIRLIENSTLAEQGYTLEINDSGIIIQGDGAGLFYGICTLKQLLMHYGHDLPFMNINDAPDFPARGVMLDISRDKVPTMATLFALVDKLASLKINQLQLYIEHTFVYIGHEKVWALASPMTAQEILELDVYCRERYVELVPNQNSLGHMERWLKFPEYATMAETPDGFQPDWGGPRRSASTLDPLDPNSFDLIRSLFDQYLPNFSSKTFNVGCDEPWELGQGKSKDAVESRGGRVYLDWMLKLYEDVSARGYQMMFWGDIINHHPDLVPELPDDIIVMEWGYEADHDFDGHCKVFADSGIPFYVCPGTSAWNTLIGRTENAMGNLRNAAENGLKYGAMGYLNTVWGDNGHMQPLSVSYLGFAYGAALSWGYENNGDVDIQSALSRFMFHDTANVMGQLAYDFGKAYHELDWDKNFNGHLLAYLTQVPYIRDRAKAEKGHQTEISKENLYHVIDHLADLQAQLAETTMQGAEGDSVIAEYQQASALMQHTAKWLLFIRGENDQSAQDLLLELESLIAQQRDVWLARNRRGGLEDSIARFDSMRQDYMA